MKKNAKCNRTSIGGQAVMEGVMMRGKTSMATAVRNPDGEIVVSSSRLKPNDNKFFKIPVVRGVVAFITSLVSGTKTLLNSAEVYGDIEAEPTKFEKWLSEKTKIDVMDIAIWIGLILGLALSVGLFFILPTFLAQLVDRYVFANTDVASDYPVWYNLMEGLVRIAIFVGYILAVSLMKDIRRVLMYHGAEHKTISCYEHGLEMTVENAQKMTTVHDRCGTTFIFIIMVVSILLFSIVGAVFKRIGWDILQSNVFARVGVRILLLPLVAGVSYEFLKLFAKSDNIIFRICKAPGLLLQKLTTRQPTDDMVEVAITAFNQVLAMEADQSIPESQGFAKSFKNWYTTQSFYFKDKGVDLADLDWLACSVLGVKRSELKSVKLLTKEQQEKLESLIKQRFEGRPVQYILGNTNFYGLEIDVDESVLIPRADTEIVVERAIDQAKATGAKTVLDACTGSGAIAVTMAKNLPDVKVFALDISDKALEKAKANAHKNGVSVEFFNSDMFENAGVYDMIVCNPPYVTAEEMKELPQEVKKEPQNALYGGEDGLDFYRIIADQGVAHLTDGGVMVLEIGCKQAESVTQLFGDKAESVTVFNDLEDRPRGVVVKLRSKEADKTDA